MLATRSPHPAPPVRRADCLEGPRPCPWTACRYHLRLEPVAKGCKGPGPDVTETCALDLAALGGMSLDEVGTVLGLSRERIRQLETKALRKLKEGTQHLAPGP